MEVSGATGNVTQSYHDDDNNQCAQCEEESGQVSPSAGFCETCNDFLCSACIKQHKTFRGTRYHELLEGDNRPLKRPTPTDVEQCSVHQDRAVEMYCLDEDILGCTMCFSIGHRMCQNIDLISNLSKDVETSEDMKEFQSASDKQKAISNQIVEKIHELRSTNDNCHSECLQDYHSFHSKMLDMLDKLGSKVSERANKLKKMNDEKLEKLLNMILLYDKQVVSLVENIDKMLDHVNCQRDQLFIALKKSKNQILESVQKSEQLTSELYIELFHFSCDFSIKQLLATSCKFVSFGAVAPVSEGSRDINSNAKEQTYTATCKELIKTNNNVGPEPTTASTSKGSTERDSNVASDTASPSTSKESIEKDNSVGPEQTTTSTSKGSIKKNNNVSPEPTTASTSKGSIEIDNNVASDTASPSASKESIKKDSNVGPEQTTPSTSNGSIEKDSSSGPEQTTASTSKRSINKINNVSTEPTTASTSKGSIEKNNNVSPEPRAASTSKGSIEKDNCVGPEQTTASTSKESIEIDSNVSTEQTTASTAKESIEKNNNVGTEQTTASISNESVEIDSNVASDTASTSTSKGSIEKNNNVITEPKTASTSKGSIEKDNNDSTEQTTALTSKGSIEKDNNVITEQATASTSKGSIEKDNNVSTEQTPASTSKGSIEKDNNVSTEQTTASTSKGSIEIDSNVSTEQTTTSTSKGSTEIDSNVSTEQTTASTSKGSIEKDNNVSTEQTTALTSKGFIEKNNNVGTKQKTASTSKVSIEKDNNVSTEQTTALTSKGSIEKNNNVGTEQTTASTSKGSIEKKYSVGKEQTTASTSKGSIKKGNNVGVASTTPPAAEGSIVEEMPPGTKCRGNEQKNKHFRQEALVNVCEATFLMNIKSPEDKYNCCIYGMVLISQSELILSDRDNSCLKLIDIDREKIIKRQHLKSTPWDVCLMPESRVAVSFPGTHEIQIYTADRNLHNCKSLRVAGRCRGLDCSGDTIAVSFSGPAMVQILDLMGKVMKTIQLDFSGKLLFCAPFYLTISLDNKRIYVSDKSKGTITCVDSERGVCWVYKDKKLELPCGLTLEDNRCLYVCSLKNHTIHVVSPDGVCRAIIPNSQSGVQCPRAVCYSGNEHTLYISSELQKNCIQKLRLQ